MPDSAALRATAAIPTSIAIDAVTSTSAATGWSCRPAPPLALKAAVSARRLSRRAVLVLLILRAGGNANLNVRAALLHVLSDLLGSVAAIVAALVILWTGWTPIDPLLSMLITLLILRSAWLITRDAAHILLEGAPGDVDVREVQSDLEANVPDVQSVHHVHAWSLTENRHLMTLHARVSDTAPPERVAAAIKERLRSCHGIVHATVEVEHGACADAAAPKPAEKG